MAGDFLSNKKWQILDTAARRRKEKTVHKSNCTIKKAVCLFSVFSVAF